VDKWHSIDEVLDFAISEEKAAAEFYMRLADQSKTPGMRQIFEGFAQEEMAHKAKLEAIKAGGTLRPAKQQVADLRMAEYMVDVAPGPEMNYQDALVLAMKKEKAAFRLYTDLATSANNDKVKATLLALAQEDARHKLRFEIEYDDRLAEN
jgi:rubrerythrin